MQPCTLVFFTAFYFPILLINGLHSPVVRLEVTTLLLYSMYHVIMREA